MLQRPFTSELFCCVIFWSQLYSLSLSIFNAMMLPVIIQQCYDVACNHSQDLYSLNHQIACANMHHFNALARYIRPENVPTQYGGLSRPSDLENGPAKPASEFTVKGGEKVNIQIEGIEVTLLFNLLALTFLLKVRTTVNYYVI